MTPIDRTSLALPNKIQDHRILQLLSQSGSLSWILSGTQRSLQML